MKSTTAIDKKKVPATETAVCTILYETTHQFGLWTDTTTFSKGTGKKKNTLKNVIISTLGVNIKKMYNKHINVAHTYTKAHR